MIMVVKPLVAINFHESRVSLVGFGCTHGVPNCLQDEQAVPRQEGSPCKLMSCTTCRARLAITHCDCVEA